LETASQQGVLAEWVREERELRGVPGLAVAVWRDGLFEAAADGVADLETGEPATVETPFRIASITKPFTATLALLSGVPFEASPAGARTRATVRQLLSHTSGLASEWPRPLAGYGEGDGALARLADDAPEELPLAPGELFSYCNAGFWLVAAAVAARVGTTYEEALSREVLEPLGLEATGFETPPRAARGHVPVAASESVHRAVAPEPYPRVRRPSGGLWSQVAEVARFGIAQLDNPRFAALHEPQTGTAEGGDALGWRVRETAGGLHLVEHWGSVAGFESLLVVVPAERLVVAALTNSARGGDAITGLLRRLDLDLAVPETMELPPGELAALAGRYGIQNLELVVAPEGDGLVVSGVEIDPVSGERIELPPRRGRALTASPRRFVVVDGDAAGDRFDFPRPGMIRVGVVALRIS
jgi:CubicO group peptidase (beta-lactamase class C family)